MLRITKYRTCQGNCTNIEHDKIAGHSASARCVICCPVLAAQEASSYLLPVEASHHFFRPAAHKNETTVLKHKATKARCLLCLQTTKNSSSSTKTQAIELHK